MRTFNAGLVLMLSGCAMEPVIENKATQAKADDQIECALDGELNFARDCAIERGEGTMLTLRHSDGGFRRLTLEANRAIDTADGADLVVVQSLSDRRTEISVGEDRYRLPPGL